MLCSNGQVGIKVRNLYLTPAAGCFQMGTSAKDDSYLLSDGWVPIWGPLGRPQEASSLSFSWFLSPTLFFDDLGCRQRREFLYYLVLAISWDSFMKLSSWEMILKVIGRLKITSQTLSAGRKLEFQHRHLRWTHTHRFLQWSFQILVHLGGVFGNLDYEHRWL